MAGKIKYNSINSRVLIDALDCIPLIRDGKADVNALTSFHQDIKTFNKFRRSYDYSEDKAEKLCMIDKWNCFIEMRNAEDFICYSESKNKSFYFVSF